MSAVTTHVLDASAGRPAAGVAVRLAGPAPEGPDAEGPGTTLAEGVTDDNGRISELGPATLAAGDYRLTFATGEYFARRGVETFYPQVQITFQVADPAQHYHVPLLLSPFSYSTYRGS